MWRLAAIGGILLVLLAGCSGHSNSKSDPPKPVSQSAARTVARNIVRVKPGFAINPGRASIVCIDPGHPSEVSAGDEDHFGTTEAQTDWVVAIRLKSDLEALGHKVVMTMRSKGELVTNRRRAEIANASGAAVMVRLHCDDSASPAVRGFKVIYPSRAGTHEGTTGPSAAVCAKSKAAAESIHEGLRSKLEGEIPDLGIKTDLSTARGKIHGALIGSIHATVPTVLVEMVFLSNPDDATFIKSRKGEEMMAAGLTEGIREYVEGAARTRTPISSVDPNGTRVKAGPKYPD